MGEMQIIYKGINELIPYDKNPRKNDEGVDKVAESIKQFGFRVPIVIDKNNVIVCGHTRLKASKKLKLDKVPCIMVDDLTEEQIQAFRLADNKVAEFSWWDWKLLDNELNDITTIDMTDFGFEFDIPEPMYDKDGNQLEFVANAEYLWSNFLLKYYDRDRATMPFGIPVLQPETHIDLPEDFVDFNNLNYYESHYPYIHEFGVRFYQDDSKIDKLWRNPEHWIERIREFRCCVMPDFSTYGDFPLNIGLFNTYRSFLIGQIMQDYGIPVICDLTSYADDIYGQYIDMCYPKGSYYALSTKGFIGKPEVVKWLKITLDKCLEELDPRGILLFGNDIPDYDWTKWEGIEKRVYSCPQFYKPTKGGKG